MTGQPNNLGRQTTSHPQPTKSHSQPSFQNQQRAAQAPNQLRHASYPPQHYNRQLIPQTPIRMYAINTQMPTMYYYPSNMYSQQAQANPQLTSPRDLSMSPTSMFASHSQPATLSSDASSVRLDASGLCISPEADLYAASAEYITGYKSGSAMAMPVSSPLSASLSDLAGVPDQQAMRAATLSWISNSQTSPDAVSTSFQMPGSLSVTSSTPVTTPSDFIPMSAATGPSSIDDGSAPQSPYNVVKQHAAAQEFSEFQYEPTWVHAQHPFEANQQLTFDPNAVMTSVDLPRRQSDSVLPLDAQQVEWFPQAQQLPQQQQLLPATSTSEHSFCSSASHAHPHDDDDISHLSEESYESSSSPVAFVPFMGSPAYGHFDFQPVDIPLSSSAASSSSTGATGSLDEAQAKQQQMLKKYQCQICGKYFRRDLPRHLRTHQEVARFTCPYPRDRCPHKRGQFNRPYDFKKHLLHCHFTFDDQKKVRSFRNLRSKLNHMGTCTCGQRFTADKWLEEHVLGGSNRCSVLVGPPLDRLSARDLDMLP